MAKRVSLYQLVPAIMPGDAISSSVLALHRSARARGYNSRIFARWIDPSIPGQVLPLERCKPGRGDILIYHFAVGSELTDFVIRNSHARLVLIYHNLTPPHYFQYEDPVLARSLRVARYQLAQLQGLVDLAIADSHYSAHELSDLGYSNLAVVPPVHLDEKYETPFDQAIMESFADGKTNLLFVSRIAPNKKQEDVIKVYHYYKHINPDSRLFLVGPLGVTKVYYRWLLDLVEYLGLPDVHCTDRVSQEELNAYYLLADVFVSMSEHEGFGMFLVESMYFGVPVVAYKSTAVPETLGQGGVLVREKDFPVIAEVIHLLVSDQDFRRDILEAQCQRLQDFTREKVEACFWNSLAPLLEG